MLENILFMLLIWALNCLILFIVLITVLNVYIMRQNNGGTFKKNKKGG